MNKDAQRVANRAAKCTVCGKSVRIYVPAGGDGSVDVFARHIQHGVLCKGSRRDVPIWHPSDDRGAKI